LYEERTSHLTANNMSLTRSLCFALKFDIQRAQLYWTYIFICCAMDDVLFRCV